MAAKSITVAASADAALAALDAYVGERGGRMESTPLQNGTRVRIAGEVAIALNVYPSKTGGCKIVFDQPESPEADAIAELVAGRPSIVKSGKSAGGTIEPVLEEAPCWIGSDESGKGDYFGPLVVAAVAVTSSNWRVLVELGVQDSKNLTDARARGLADEIRGAFPNEVITVMPRRYNELWASMRNVNRLLAWAHARAIENVIARAPEATAAVADQFGDEALIRDALFEHGRRLRLVQMHRAERDPAVAAASILARAEFLRRLAQLGRDAGVRLPKGAGPAVDAVARTIASSRGAGALDAFAKTHFKTTKRVS